MEEVLSLALKSAEAAEVYSLEVEETPVVFEANRLKQLLTRHRHTLALRLIRHGKLGFAQGVGQGDKDGLVARAVAVAEYSAPAAFKFPPHLPPAPVAVYDPQMEKLTPQEMVKLGEALIDRVHRPHPELLCHARLVKAMAHIRLINSSGGQLSYDKSYFGIDLEGVLVRGTDMLFVGDEAASCHPLQEAEEVADSVLRQVGWGQRLAPAPAGEVPVLLMPQAAASAIFFPFSAGFNGRMVLEGASPLKGKIGEKCFSPELSLWDDATLPFRPGSRPYDDEGTPARRTPLVEKGVVASFFYDLQTGGKAGVPSTGNASREMRGNPLPTPWALVFSPGKTPTQQIVQDIPLGLMVEGLIGAEQGNILGGEFSGNVLLGYRIEKGEVVGRVKDTMLSGNVYQALKEGVMLAREGRWVGSRLFIPPLYFPRLAVASKG